MTDAEIAAKLTRIYEVMARAFADPIGLMNSVSRMDEYAGALQSLRALLKETNDE